MVVELIELHVRFVNKCHNHDLNCFFEIPILGQLRSMYKRPGFYESLDHRVRHSQRYFTDIQDGSVYKSLPEDFLKHPHRITSTWNSDGVLLFKSSKFNFWPLFLMMNELPYRLRVKKENMILAGLWFGPMNPPPDLFLSVFQDDLKKTL
ncbi:hypothetical protein QAD02_012633 [Eretmocerus hayati]|uniref:Uncharacterized protein n=1 Tax=Eretmocerus hayati TaxID=131215 RepID=A0ACC2P1B2_9HYME|nr:hypothetical protein QAD02_012633 [Eretmocerus hayati]